MIARFALIGALCAGCLAAAAPAGAGTNIGATCAAPIYTSTAIMQFSIAAGAPSYTVPAEGGILTRWAVAREAGAIANPTKLKIFRFSGTPSQFTTVAEDPQIVGAGTAEFATRIPVIGGDLLGIYGGVKTPVCVFGSAANLIVNFNPPGDTPVGSTLPIGASSGSKLVDVAAYLEPDSDDDGFGDESQDQCPIVAATQGPCPPVDASGPAIGTKAFKLSKLRKKSKIEMTVSSNEAATVTIDGTLSVPGGSSKTYKLKPVSGSVPAGGRIKLKLKVPKKGLKALRKKGKATSIVNVIAKDTVGNQSTGKFTSKMKIVKTKRVVRR